MILANRNGLKNTRNMLRVFGGLNETYSCTEAEYSAGINFSARNFPCLLYTSDAADEEDSVYRRGLRLYEK